MHVCEADLYIPSVQRSVTLLLIDQFTIKCVALCKTAYVRTTKGRKNIASVGYLVTDNW